MYKLYLKTSVKELCPISKDIKFQFINQFNSFAECLDAINENNLKKIRLLDMKYIVENESEHIFYEI